METTENKAVVNTDTSTTTTGTTTKCPEYKLINLRKGPGRPKGTKNKPVVGMPINKRLKLLSKIAMNKNTKPTDVINAVKEITALLNDRVKEAQEGQDTILIKFEEDKEEAKETKEAPEFKDRCHDKNKKDEIIKTEETIAKDEEKNNKDINKKTELFTGETKTDMADKSQQSNTDDAQILKDEVVTEVEEVEVEEEAIQFNFKIEKDE